MKHHTIQNTIQNTNQNISINNLWKKINTFIDDLINSKKISEWTIKQHNELNNIFHYLQWKWSISHDLLSTFWMLAKRDILILKSSLWEKDIWEEFKQWLENSIKIIELSYNKDKKIWWLIQHLKKYIHNDFLNHLQYNGNIKNYTSIDNEEFFILAIAENLYKNAERFTTDMSSINLCIQEEWNAITISSSNISLQKFEEKNREIIISGQWNIVSQAWNNNIWWQWVYLVDLSRRLQAIGWTIQIDSKISETWWYHTNIRVMIPKQ
jgi:hypothetical protein